MAEGGLWDEEDKFFYDVLNLPDDARVRLRIRSMVGLIPLFAVETLEPEMLEKLPGFRKRLEWFLEHRPHLASLVSHWQSPGRGERRLLSLLRGHRMKRLLQRMLDESEFLSDYGVRALSRAHLERPYVFRMDGNDLSVRYTPAESDTRQFGGNSNWRGPIWFPLNFLIIESLQKFHHYYGDDFKVECPTGSGRLLTIQQIAEELSHRLSRIFLKDGEGKRPVLRHTPELQSDPFYRDLHSVLRVFRRRQRPRRRRLPSDRLDRADRQASHAAGARLDLRPTTRVGECAMSDAADTKIDRPDEEWKKELPPETFTVMRKHGTERAGTSPLNNEHRPGMYACAACGLPLFESSTKFDSGSGWPSFFAPLPKAVGTTTDRTLGMSRTEVHCARCGGHLGHVFPDGPRPTGERYCMNGVALRFEPK